MHGCVWETFEKNEILKKIWQMGGGEVIVLFRFLVKKKNCAVFEDLETNLRLLGRKYNGDNFDG